MTDNEIPQQRPPSAVPPVPFPPVRVATKREKPVERIPLFYLDDVEYTIPAKVPATAIVALLNNMRYMSDEAAISYMIVELMGGEQAMKDLEQAEGLEMDQLAEIIANVKMMALAASKRVTGK